MKVFGHYIHLPILLLVTAEFIVSNLAFLGSWLLLRVTGTAAGFWPYPLSGAPGFGIAVVFGVTSMGLYQAKQRLRIEGVLARLGIGVGIGAVCVALVDSYLSLETAGTIWGLSVLASLFLLGVTRTLFWKCMERGSFQRRVLVYGAGSRATNLLQLRRRSDRRGFNIAAFVPAGGDHLVLDDDRVAKPDGSLLEFAKSRGVDEIVVAMDDRRQAFPVADLLKCKFSGIAVVDLVPFLERETGKLKLDVGGASWLIFSEGFDSPLWLRIATRALDLVVGLTLLVLAAPIMFFVAIAILLDDGWPVFYRQRRVGRMGKVFTLYKFRSMVRNAEAAGAPQWAGVADKRATRTGAILRRLRLDELPQLFNVVCGHMSLVGPRPERPEFVTELAEKIPYFHERHTVKPGITGWAQLSYPYGASDHDAQEKLQYDLYYIKHKSLVFDLMILLQTAEVVLWGKGAR